MRRELETWPWWNCEPTIRSKESWMETLHLPCGASSPPYQDELSGSCRATPGLSIFRCLLIFGGPVDATAGDNIHVRACLIAKLNPSGISAGNCSRDYCCQLPPLARLRNSLFLQSCSRPIRHLLNPHSWRPEAGQPSRWLVFEVELAHRGRYEAPFAAELTHHDAESFVG
jgi:hypothetical protein